MFWVIGAPCNVFRWGQHFFFPSFMLEGISADCVEGMAKFFACTFYGRNSAKFSESEYNFSATDKCILPSDGWQTSSYESTLEDSGYKDPTDLQCRSCSLSRRVLWALPHNAQLLLSAWGISRFSWNKSLDMRSFTWVLSLHGHLSVQDCSRLEQLQIV